MLVIIIRRGHDIKYTSTLQAPRYRNSYNMHLATHFSFNCNLNWKTASPVSVTQLYYHNNCFQMLNPNNKHAIWTVMILLLPILGKIRLVRGCLCVLQDALQALRVNCSAPSDTKGLWISALLTGREIMSWQGQNTENQHRNCFLEWVVFIP